MKDTLNRGGPEYHYRLRVGDWRVLFEISGGAIVIHQVLHRSKAYD